MNALRAARPFGILPWKDEVLRWGRWAPKWPAARLREALRATLETDRSLKSTTLSDERALLADLVMRLTIGEKVGALGLGGRRKGRKVGTRGRHVVGWCSDC